jgi:peptide/nickel transport system permease protein
LLNLLSRLLVLLSLLSITFVGTRALVRALPGDPLETLLAESGTSLPRELLNQQLGLNKPFLEALGDDARRSLHGDFGISLLSKKPIAPVLAQRFQKTLELGASTALLALLFSLTLGVLAASRPGRGVDRFCTLYGAITAALPIPWIGPMILLVFAVWIPLFPVGGHPLLPALALALQLSGLWSRLVRERVREELLRGSATGARARGIPEWKILLKYALTPASGSLLAFLGTQVGALLAGAFVVEIIFDWRGLGHLLVDSVLKRDYPLIEAATFLAASMSLIGTFAGDWAQKRLDTRLRETEDSWA